MDSIKYMNVALLSALVMYCTVHVTHSQSTAPTTAYPTTANLTNVNTTTDLMTTEPPHTTFSPNATVCYSCNGTDCANATSANTGKCASTSGACWMYYQVSTGVATRACNSIMSNVACTSTLSYPNGQSAQGACQYCCTGSQCNSNALLASTCQSIINNTPNGGSGASIPTVARSLLILVVSAILGQRLV